MDPLTIGLITGGASLLGNIFSSTTAADTSAQNTQANIAAQQQMQSQSEAFNAAQAKQAEDFSATQASYNRDFQANQAEQSREYDTASVANQENFQTQMSNSAYQRASADMKAAGLNPMMMFGSGGPASVPSGASAMSPTPGGSSASGVSASIGTPNMALANKPNPLAGFAGIGDAVGKVFSTAQGVQALTKQQADIDLTRAQKHNVDADTLRTDVVTNNEGQRGGGIPSEVAKKAAEATILRNAATTATNVESMNPAVRKAVDIGGYVGNKVGDTVAPIINSAGALRRMLPSRSTSETTDSRTGDSTFSDKWSGLYQ